mgnify:CR=1 FL=1
MTAGRKILIAFLLFCILPACRYEDFRVDYPYSSVYFTNQILSRNFVEDEVSSIKIGVVLGGKRVNDTEEWVRFTLEDTSGMGDSPYELLPEDYYTLSSYEQFVIEEGEFMGEVTMEIDPSFFQDPLAYQDHYALVFRITDASTDSVLYGKDSLLLVLGFESSYFGNYYHNGRVIRRDTVTGSVVDTVAYHQEEPVTDDVNVWPLITGGSRTVYTMGIAYFAPSELSGFYIIVDDENELYFREDTVLISKGYDWELEKAEGGNYYDPGSKKFYLNYGFTDILNGYHCHATDTLIFRNRILDGVNQWNF